MTARLNRPTLLLIVPVVLACLHGLSRSQPATDAPPPQRESNSEESMTIHYLEIVTPEVDATCTALARIHDVTFSDPVAVFGNARTAPLHGGGLISVRGPMRETETPVVRPYIRVDDLKAAVEAARAAGGEIAIEAMEIPGHGTIAIYLLGGIEHGLWQP